MNERTLTVEEVRDRHRANVAANGGIEYASVTRSRPSIITKAAPARTPSKTSAGLPPAVVEIRRGRELLAQRERDIKAGRPPARLNRADSKALNLAYAEDVRIAAEVRRERRYR